MWEPFPNDQVLPFSANQFADWQGNTWKYSARCAKEATVHKYVWLITGGKGKGGGGAGRGGG